MEVLTNAMEVIALQYIIVLNQPVVHFKLYNDICQLYFNKPGKKLKYICTPNYSKTFYYKNVNRTPILIIY